MGPSPLVQAFSPLSFEPMFKKKNEKYKIFQFLKRDVVTGPYPPLSPSRGGCPTREATLEHTLVMCYSHRETLWIPA